MADEPKPAPPQKAIFPVMPRGVEHIGIIFARESNRYDKTVYSLTSQVEACLERARAEGVVVEERHVFREQFSGRDLHKMPKLGEMRRLLESTPGRKRVYCYAQDRLFR